MGLRGSGGGGRGSPGEGGMRRVRPALFGLLRLGGVCRDRLQPWLATRPWELLLQASPALLLGSALVAVMGYEWAGADAAAVQRYRAGARELLDPSRDLGAGDRAAAEMYARKLERLDGSSPETAFAKARLAELLGHAEQSEKLMHDLAPEDRRGYPAAHYWVARRLGRRWQEADVPQTARLMHHLRQAAACPTARLQAQIWLAQLLARQGNRAEAARHLEAVVPDRPDMRLPLSALYRDMGDTYRAREHRERAVEHFRRQVERHSGDAGSRVLWAQAEGLGGNFVQAERILLEGRAGNPDNQALKRALAELYVARFDALSRDRGRTFVRRQQLLRQALACDPGNREVWARWARLIIEAPADREWARAMEREALVYCELPPAVHLALGTSAAMRGEMEKSRHHLEQAYAGMPTAPEVLNNLALVLVAGRDGQLDRALSLADAAARLRPEDPEIRDTRGQILLRLRRWREAVGDLEVALRGLPGRAAVFHGRLAQAYQGLGDGDLAARHLRLAAGECR